MNRIFSWCVRRSHGRALLGASLLAGVFLTGCGTSPRQGAVDTRSAAGSGPEVPGTFTVTVPNVVGDSLVDADNRLSQSHLLCRSAPQTSTEAQGTVLSQSTAPDTKVPNLSIVTVNFAVSASFPRQELIGNGCAIAFHQISN